MNQHMASGNNNRQLEQELDDMRKAFGKMNAQFKGLIGGWLFFLLGDAAAHVAGFLEQQPQSPPTASRIGDRNDPLLSTAKLPSTAPQGGTPGSAKPPPPPESRTLIFPPRE